MINKYWLEVSKIYARLMRLELKIKQNAYIAVKKYYKDGSLEAFDKFFNNKRRKRRYTNDRCNKLELIINLLVSLYDDIAFYNGVPINELPSPWTILREVYRLKANVNFGVGIQDYLADLV